MQLLASSPTFGQNPVVEDDMAAIANDTVEMLLYLVHPKSMRPVLVIRASLVRLKNSKIYSKVRSFLNLLVLITHLYHLCGSLQKMRKKALCRQKLRFLIEHFLVCPMNKNIENDNN